MKTIKNLLTGTFTALLVLLTASSTFAQNGDPIPGINIALEQVPQGIKKITKEAPTTTSTTGTVVTEDELKAKLSKTGNKGAIPGAAIKEVEVIKEVRTKDQKDTPGKVPWCSHGTMEDCIECKLDDGCIPYQKGQSDLLEPDDAKAKSLNFELEKIIITGGIKKTVNLKTPINTVKKTNKGKSIHIGMFDTAEE